MSLKSRIVKGVKNMLTKRGDEDFVDIECKIGSAIKTQDVLIYIPEIIGDDISKIKNETVHYIFYLIESLGLDHLIIIYSQITPQALEILTVHKVYRIELFKHKQMLFDPTTHKKTPHHRKMTQLEIDTELKGLRMCDLPSIKESDVIVRFFDWEVGDTIKIDRIDGSPYYRVVVKE